MKASFQYESALWKQGFTHVVGVDEVGCGCWAGDVFAAAVILPSSFRSSLVQDSKALRKGQREEVEDWIKTKSIAWAIGRANLEEIFTLNIRQAALLAMRRALEQLQPQPSYVLSDGFLIPGISLPNQKIIRGDAKSKSIAAASIIAKVARDRYMEDMDQQYPGYGFAQHVGYGTKQHQDALERLGPTKIHRMGYRPLKALMATKAAADQSS